MPKKIIAAALLGFLALSPAAAAKERIYSRIAPNGVHVYSDRPESSSLQKFEIARPSSLHIHITEPAAGSSLVNPVGSLKLGYKLSLPPPPGSRIQALVDGQPHTAAAEGEKLLLRSLAPGEHRIQLQLLSAEGKLLGKSQPATYYLLRPVR